MEQVSYSGLKSLPVEILGLVLREISPNDVFNLHLTCHNLVSKTRDSIKAHRDKSKKLYVQSDLHPLTIPSLLRRVVQNDPDLWHVQRLELWGHRPSWQFWTDHPDLRRHFPWLNTVCPQNVSHFFSDEELATLKKICLEKLSMTTFRANGWMDELQAGNDAPMQVMLIALLPRLKRVVFVPAPRISTQSTWHYILELLGQLIRVRYNPSFSRIGTRYHASDWPPGLRSIEAIEIYSHPRYSRLVGNMRSDLDLAPPFGCSEALMRMPNLKRAYLQFGHGGRTTRTLSRTSKVEELCLALAGLYKSSIIEMCSNLRCLYTTEEGYFSPASMSPAIQQSLETLPSHCLLGELSFFPNLRAVEIMAARCLTEGDPKEDFVSSPHLLETCLPRSVQSLKIVRDVPRTMSEAPPDLRKAELVMEALVSFVKKRTMATPRNLRALCLSDLLQDFDTGFAHIAGVRSWEVWNEVLNESSLQHSCRDVSIELITRSHNPCHHGVYGSGAYEASHGPMLMSVPEYGVSLNDSGFSGWSTPLG